ncbi:HdeD family acid-resistance protein [Gordonia shandongensis]|uniref:HdeD family acid-resistance protein n=1 Tax=Gordonia shandongensis TaxID=376351 RepID=UPI0003FB629C|nr:HdeD family acid-resistance protein [Gordonia shandongensis]
MTFEDSTARDPLGAARAALTEVAHRTWQSLLGIGVVSVLLGVIVLVWPAPTLLVAAILFGAYLLVSGVFQIAATFGVQAVSGWWRLLTFISGVISVGLGFVAFRNIAASVVLLAIWIGIGWVFRGCANLAVAVDMPKGTPGRGWAIFLGALTLIAGGVLVTSPIDTIGTLVVVSGVMLVAVGVSEIVNALALRSQLPTIARYAANAQ